MFNVEAGQVAYYDCDETDAAVKDFQEWQDSQGLTGDQPNRSDTRREGDIIIIASKRIMARYQVNPDGTVTRIEDDE